MALPFCEPSKIEIGEQLSRTSYMKVVGHPSNDIYQVKNQDGFQWSISADILEKECVSADQYRTETLASKTELAEILSGAGSTVFTVAFHKQVTQAQVALKLENAENEDLLVARKRRALAKDILSGELRVLVGHLIKSEAGLGRSRVMDLEVNEERLVDHRTIEWIILGQTKHVLRGGSA